MPGLLLNIDVPDIAAAEAFYTAAWGLRVGRRFDTDFVELIGLEAPIYLLLKDAGTVIGPVTVDERRYNRHWSPIHPDIVVDNITVATERALAAGATCEAGIRDAAYGRIAMFADPFGHGFCLIEFNKDGYDALLA